MVILNHTSAPGPRLAGGSGAIDLGLDNRPFNQRDIYRHTALSSYSVQGIKRA